MSIIVIIIKWGLSDIRGDLTINTKPLFLVKEHILIYFEGKLLKINNHIYRNINRYFLPLLEFVKNIKGRYRIIGQRLYLYFDNKPPITMEGENNNYKFTMINGEVYISLFDICKILKIKSRWLHYSKTILLYWDRETDGVKSITSTGRPALIRLEDVTAGDEYLDASNLEKLRVSADYLFSMGIPFHIAWISRFIDPGNGIDNDISKDYSMANAHFLFTMEYLLNRNALIGLHGYTHQYGDEVSGVGTEFNKERNNDKENIEKRVEAAINISRKLELPYSFFESPHYAATEFQQSIFENYFNIIYEGCVGIWGEKIVVSPRNHRTLYIPTPLGYVEGEKGTEEILTRINNLTEDTLASLFYHPYIEFNYITLSYGDKGYPLGFYQEESPLQRICRELHKKGCKFTKVTEIN